MLLDALAPGTVAWGHAVTEVAPEADGWWRLEFKDRPAVTADLVVGADGVGSKVRGQLTPVRPRSVGMTMLAAVIREELWRGSELSDLLGEGSVMFADHHQTIFVQRCGRDLILLYYSMVVLPDWPKSAGFGLDDTNAVSASRRSEPGPGRRRVPTWATNQCDRVRPRPPGGHGRPSAPIVSLEASRKQS